MTKFVKFSAAALCVAAAVILAMVLPGGRAAAASAKAVTCPDNTSGIKYEGRTIVCTGQAALGATVTISPATSAGLPIAIVFPLKNAFVSASASFDKKKSTGQIILTSQSTGSQAYVTVVVTPAVGHSPGGVSVARPRKLAGRTNYAAIALEAK